MDVARHAQAFVQRGGLPQPAQEIEAVEPRDGEPGDHVAENQVVDPHRPLVEGEQAAADKLAVEAPGLHLAHAESRLERGVDRSADALPERTARPVHHDAPLVAGVGGLKRLPLQPGQHERPVGGLGLRGPRHVAARPPRKVDLALVWLLPDEEHLRGVEHRRTLGDDLADQLPRLPRRPARPADDPADLALKAMLVRPEIRDEGRGDREMHAADDERVGGETGAGGGPATRTGPWRRTRRSSRPPSIPRRGQSHRSVPQITRNVK